jgi:hypothetical protein
MIKYLKWHGIKKKKVGNRIHKNGRDYRNTKILLQNLNSKRLI